MYRHVPNKEGRWMKIAVIGGGASGMMAAVTAAQNGEQVCLLERQPRVGKKLLATGNGRCNLSNLNLAEDNYHGRDASFAMDVIKRFDVADTLEFFHGLGLLTAAEADGRLYPLSNYAGSVVDVLRFAAEAAGVEMITGLEVVSVRRIKTGGFLVSAADASLEADKVIICCGGMAGARVGGVKSGYELLESMGHRITKLHPALVQIKTDNAYVRSLKGVRAEAKAVLMQRGGVLAASEGEIQFTDFGVSGPAAFDISRAAATAAGDVMLHIDLLYSFSQEEIESILLRRRNTMRSLTAENLLTGVLHNRLGRTVLRYAGYELSTPVGMLKKDDLRRIAAACKDFALPVQGTMGFDAAQVAAGGAQTSEFCPATLQSRLVSGLYAAGEVLDVDGDCGGYNLQWAWSSGHLAGLTLDADKSSGV